MEKTLLLLWVGLATLWTWPGNYWFAHWYSKWAVVLFGAGVYVLWTLRGKYRGSTLALFGWSLGSALLAITWTYKDWAATDQLAIHNSVLYCALAMVTLGSWVPATARIYSLHSRMYGENPVVWALRWAVLWDLLTMVWQAAIGVERVWTGGAVGNPSMNSSFIAICLPLFFTGRWRWLVPGLLAAVVYPGASQPLGVLVVVGFGALVVRAMGRKEFTWLVPLTLASVAFTLAVGAALIPRPELFSDNGRWDVWVKALAWWGENANPVLGSGLGTWQSLSPLILASQRGGHAFLFLHSDWLQILFELGVGGVALAVGVFGTAVQGACQRAAYAGSQEGYLLPMVLGYAALMGANYPFHLPVTAMLGVWLVKETTRR